jgi:nucleoside-diphosphate-sugar epimerase
MTPQTQSELDHLLSTPSPADLSAMSALTGDLLILGVAGKMGPTLAVRAARAVTESGAPVKVIGVSRFSDPNARAQLESAGIETIAADLLDSDQLDALPEAPNVIFMAARKFGSTGDEALTWAMNTWLPAQVARRYRDSRIVAFSSGNVYPLVPVSSGGAMEETPPGPIGEYAQSVLGRERLFEHFSKVYGTPGVLLRLNYAVELRYGVLYDIARKVFDRRPVDVTMGHANVIWQGDANSVCLRSFDLCASPTAVLNLTGPETLAVRDVAAGFGARFGVDPIVQGTEAETALLNNASRCTELFGPPAVTVDQMMDWIAAWIEQGGETLNKPTHFEARDGKF